MCSFLTLLALIASITLTTAAPLASSCSDDGALFTVINGDIYRAECGKDRFGGELTHLYVPTFKDCLEACSQRDTCVDLTYEGNVCYLKRMAVQTRAGVTGAVLVQKHGTNGKRGMHATSVGNYSSTVGGGIVTKTITTSPPPKTTGGGVVTKTITTSPLTKNITTSPPPKTTGGGVVTKIITTSPPPESARSVGNYSSAAGGGVVTKTISTSPPAKLTRVVMEYLRPPKPTKVVSTTQLFSLVSRGSQPSETAEGRIEKKKTKTTTVCVGGSTITVLASLSTNRPSRTITRKLSVTLHPSDFSKAAIRPRGLEVHGGTPSATTTTTMRILLDPVSTTTVKMLSLPSKPTVSSSPSSSTIVSSAPSSSTTVSRAPSSSTRTWLIRTKTFKFPWLDLAPTTSAS